MASDLLVQALRGMRLLALIFVIAATLSACGGDDEGSSTNTPVATMTAIESATPRPVFLEPIDGAELEFGREGSADFAIEVPEAWNGGLVLYLHGAQPFDAPLISPPPARGALIDRGYAWAASAFSDVGFIPEVAVADTNALLARFARDHGAPDRTYIYGESMGGAAAIIATEQHAGLYDGALALCASAGRRTWLDLHADYLAIGAHVADVPAGDVAVADIGTLVADVQEALGDAARNNLFVSLMVGWTGGARPFAHEPLYDIDDRWAAVGALGETGALDNVGRDYTSIGIEPGDTIVLRGTADEPSGVVDVTGALSVPVITLHDTGDAVVPLTDAIAIRQRTEAAGKGDLLVQRTVQSPVHCDFTDEEIMRAFDDLVVWADGGISPAGEDLLAFDAETLGAAFTSRPR